MKLFGNVKFKVESAKLDRGADGSYGPCYFCAAPVANGDFAVLLVERIDPKGDPIRSACHGSCLESARRI